MFRPKKLFFVPVALVLALAVGVPLYGQVGQPDDRPEDRKAQPDDQKAPANKGVFKGELKPAIHPCQLELGKNYAIRVKVKNFVAAFQLRDKDLKPISYTTQTGWKTVFGPNGEQERHLEFSFSPPETAEYNLVISQSSGVLNNNGPMDYSITVSPLKTLFSVQNQLTSSDPFHWQRSNCFYKVHLVELKAGKSYQIDLVGNFNTFLYLEDPLGNILRNDANSGSGQNSRIYFQPTTTDFYRLIATSYLPNNTGNYSLTVSDSPVAVAPLGGGGFGGGFGPGLVRPPGLVQPALPPAIPAVPKKIEKLGGIKFRGGVQAQAAPAPKVPQEDKKEGKKEDNEIVFQGEIKPAVHSFEMNSGQNYVIQVKANQFLPYFQIRNAKTNQVMMTRSGGSFNGKEYNLSFNYVAPATETYLFQITSTGSPLGQGPLEYSIEVDTFKTVFSKVDQLAATDPLYPNRPNSRYKSYPVEMKAGVTYQIDMMSGFDAYLFLEDSTGKVVRFDDDGGEGLNARIIYQPAKTDTYKIIATSFGGGATGQFTLTVSDTPITGGNLNLPFPGGGGFAQPVPLPQPFPVPAPPPAIPNFQPGGIQIQPGQIQIQQIQPGQIKIQIDANGRPVIQPLPAVQPRAEEEKK